MIFKLRSLINIRNRNTLRRVFLENRAYENFNSVENVLDTGI